MGLVTLSSSSQCEILKDTIMRLPVLRRELPKSCLYRYVLRAFELKGSVYVWPARSDFGAGSRLRRF